MRKRHFTSYKKLPILSLALLITSLTVAKDKAKDTKIVCFAAQNKWVCAPEDKQHIASQKAQKLLDEKKSEEVPTNIVIKPINIPKFQSQESKPSIPIKTPPSDNIVRQDSKPSINNELEISKPRTQENPYAKLWAHQLIGVSSPNSAIDFVKQKHLNKDDVLIIKSIREGMDWWIVLYGLYKDKQTGLTNEVNLPNNINKPWLRPLKNLKVNGFIEDF